MRSVQVIRMAAIAVVANGAIALGLMSPNVALADTCSAANGNKCDSLGICPGGNANAECAAYAPPGCKVLQAACLPYPLFKCSFNSNIREVGCTYTS